MFNFINIASKLKKFKSLLHLYTRLTFRNHLHTINVIFPPYIKSPVHYTFFSIGKLVINFHNIHQTFIRLKTWINRSRSCRFLVFLTTKPYHDCSIVKSVFRLEGKVVCICVWFNFSPLPVSPWFSDLRMPCTTFLLSEV